MLILKGIVIGIGKIIPGVSGSMLAISMGIYQKLIDSINNFFTSPKKNFKFLFKVAIGVIISIVFLSNIILKCLDKYYIITMFFFIGLIIGGFDDIKINICRKNNYITYISFIIVLLLGLINVDNDITIKNNIINSIYFIFIGFVDALTMVIPGISGTATLMMLGAYKSVMLMFSNLLYIENIKILIPYIIGMAFGGILTVKLVNYLFNYYKSKTYSAILGFSIATIFLMFIMGINSFYTFKDLIFAFILLFIGIYLSKKINHLFSD